MAAERSKAETEALTIVILQEAPMGYPDSDLSIKVPIGEPLLWQKDCPVAGMPSLTTFEEYFGYSGRAGRQLSRSPRIFPAIRIGRFYMLWVDERQEWIGIEYEYLGHGDYEQNIYGGGHDEKVDASGPYQLSELSGKVILDAFGNPPIGTAEALRTSPSGLSTFPGSKQKE